MLTVSVAKLKSHLSEIIAKSSYNKEKFIITRRNKPVAALVSIDDLQIIEQYQQRKGLADVVGKWQDFEEVSEHIDDIASIRTSGGGGRNVSI
jgi:prevent-host-death family protein